VRGCCDVEHLWAAGQGFCLNGAELPIVTERTEENGWCVTRQSLETPRGPLTCVQQVGLDGYSSHATVKHWIAEEEDVERFLSFPYRPVQPDVAPYLAACDELGKKGYVLPYFNDPIGEVHALLGSETLAIWCMSAPGLLQRLLAEFSARCQDYIRALVAAGVGPVIGLQGQETVVPPLASPRLFDDLVTRHDAPLVDLAHRLGCLVYVHCHGALNGVLERFADMGVDGLHPLEAPPMGDVLLADAKRRIGGRVCLLGNIQIGDIMDLESRDIVALTRRAIADAALGGGFVLTLTATPFERVLAPRTLENLTAMVETGREFGQYS
jgi:hypothetical protein